MSVVEQRDEQRSINRRREAGMESVTTSISDKILATYPGGKVVLGVKAKGPRDHSISINVYGLPGQVASIEISQASSIAPFTATVTILVKPEAQPGLYPFTLQLYDETRNKNLGREQLALLVLYPGLPRKLSKHFSRLIKLYLTLGSQAVIWYLLTYIFNGNATFSQLKKAYQLIINKSVSNGTIANILRRMIDKKIIYKDDMGLYHPLIKEFKIVISRIDKSRVRTLRYNTRRDSSSRNTSKAEPYEARLALRRAQKIINKHKDKKYNKLAAAYFLAYILAGIRETGVLLYWLNSWFIYCEAKQDSAINSTVNYYINTSNN